MINRVETKEFRDDITAALQSERERCAKSRFRRTLEHHNRILRLDAMLVHLQSDYDCEIEVRRVRVPGEIEL